MSKIYRTINLFDDGNDRFKQYNNKWLIIKEMYNGQKLVLQNCNCDDIIIKSISAWKTSPYHPHLDIEFINPQENYHF